MDTCSGASRAVGEPLAGTAPAARLWILLEQPGPWGRDALTQSHLDHELGKTLSTWAAQYPLRVGLIRRPGPHADSDQMGQPRTLIIARSDPGHWSLHSELIDDPRALLHRDVAMMLTDDAPQPSSVACSPHQVLAVCTNGKRDRCCAVRGRALAAALAPGHPGQVWETSHLGGHRFAPTVVSLPDGYLFAGPDAEQLTTAACRGRSTLAPEEQVAELAVLRHLDEPYPRPLILQPTSAGQWLVEDPVTGVSLEVAVETLPAGQPRRESCRKPPAPWHRLVPTVLT